MARCDRPLMPREEHESELAWRLARLERTRVWWLAGVLRAAPRLAPIAALCVAPALAVHALTGARMGPLLATAFLTPAVLAGAFLVFSMLTETRMPPPPGAGSARGRGPGGGPPDAGVREPRRPSPSSRSGAASEAPPPA